IFKFILIIQHRYYILKTRINKLRNVFGICARLKPIADDERVFCYFPFLIKLFDDLYIISKRGFNMHILLQCLLYYKRKVRAFSTVAVIILTIITVLSNGIIKYLFCLGYLLPYL